MRTANQNEPPPSSAESRGGHGLSGRRRETPAHSSATCSRREVMSTMLATGAVLGLGGLQTRLAGAEPGTAAQGSGGGVPPMDPELGAQIKGYNYFPEFRNCKDGGKVRNLTPEQLAAAGLTRETWTLDVVSEKDLLLKQPRSRAAGNAITFAEVQRLYEERPVRVLKVTTCLMGAAANHRGLWEGVALRDVLWLAQPTGAIRRVAFHALDNSDSTKQQWCSSLPPARIFEDPPGLAPVILALKFNDQWLEPKHGGPVRLIVQEHYGFKNTRHLKRVMFTAAHAATDDYAKMGQDVESPMKTVVQSLGVKGKCPVDKPLVVEGIIQVGFSGLKGVQYATVPADAPPPADDPYYLKLPWQDGVVIPAPDDFAAKIPGGPKGVFGLDPANGAPLSWPIPGYCAFWGAVIRGLKPGKYKIYARAINRNGDAQPLPRPFDNSGVSRLPSAAVEITA